MTFAVLGMVLPVLGMAWAGPPELPRPTTVYPLMEPDSVVGEYRAWAKSIGKTGDATELECAPFAENLVECFLDARGSLYTRAMGFSAPTLAAALVPGTPLGLTETHVDGFTRTYWLRAQGDGQDHVPMAWPAALAAAVAGQPVVAVPVRGAFVAWLPGDAEFDKVMGVGVRKMYETLPDPVSPLLYQWRDGAWGTWGVAKPTVGG